MPVIDDSTMEDKLVYHLMWERLREGDKNAFLDLYKACYRPLVNYGLYIYADGDLVCDTTTQVFLELWEKRSRLSRVDNVTAYLKTYLKRKLLSTLKEQRRLESAFIEVLETADNLERPYEDVIIQLQTDEATKRKLEKALLKLTPMQKRLIQLKFFDGYSYQQIAEKTKQTIKTAYNTVYDALKLLRKEIN